MIFIHVYQAFSTKTIMVKKWLNWSADEEIGVKIWIDEVMTAEKMDLQNDRIGFIYQKMNCF